MFRVRRCGQWLEMGMKETPLGLGNACNGVRVGFIRTHLKMALCLSGICCEPNECPTTEVGGVLPAQLRVYFVYDLPSLKVFDLLDLLI